MNYDENILKTKNISGIMLGLGPGGRGQRTSLITILLLALTSWPGHRATAEDQHRLKVKLINVNIKGRALIWCVARIVI